MLNSWIQNKISQALLILLLAAIAYIGLLHIGLWNRDKDINVLKKDLTTLEAKCTQDPTELQDAKEVLQLRKDQNRQEAEVRTIYITKFKKDINETDCEAANRLMRNNPIGW